jgi:5-methylcytosine-specific restriction endonuclease McrA
MVCEVCGKIYCKNYRTKHCSRECSVEAKRGVKLSKEWRKALSEGRKKSEKCKGPNLYNWKGGPENRRKKNKEYYHKRRAKGKINFEYLEALFESQGGRCYYCYKPLGDYKAIEHLEPISRGGDNRWVNLVYSCKSCNSKKRAKTLAEFAIENIRPDWLNNMVQFDAAEKVGLC